MHIPDGLLDAKTLAVAAGEAVAGLALASWNTRKLPSRRVPLMGLSAAFVFAAQMLNFPVLNGTSGHLIGGVLTAVLLGPSTAVLVVSTVLIVQCLLCSDGGLLALGANILNMAIVDSVGGYFVYRAIARVLPATRRAKLSAVAIGAWSGAVLASIVCSGELSASHRLGSPGVIFAAMVGVHALIGIGEAIITVMVIAAVWVAWPELSPLASNPAAPLLRGGDAERPAAGAFLAWGLLIAAALALFVSPFASQFPDGLDQVARTRLGFVEHTPAHASPMPDYRFPGITNRGLAMGLAGLAGTGVAFALALGVAKVLAGRRSAVALDSDLAQHAASADPPTGAAS